MSRWLSTIWFFFTSSFVAGLEKRKKEHAERVALQKAAAEAANDAAAGGQPAAGSKPSPAVAARSSPQAPAQRPAASM